MSLFKKKSYNVWVRPFDLEMLDHHSTHDACVKTPCGIGVQFWNAITHSQEKSKEFVKVCITIERKK